MKFKKHIHGSRVELNVLNKGRLVGFEEKGSSLKVDFLLQENLFK